MKRTVASPLPRPRPPARSPAQLEPQAPQSLTAKEVLALLGVRPQTLYAYVSRGLIRRAPGDVGREHRYLRIDVARLLARKEARSGHGPAAAEALHWGQPVLESRITEITPEGPRYRGEPAAALAQAGRTLEEVAEWLWADDGQPAQDPWPSAARGLAAISRLSPLLAGGARPFDGLPVVVAALGARDVERFDVASAPTLRCARALIPQLALGVGLAQGKGALADAAAVAGRGVAATLLAALGGGQRADARRAVDAALVVSADHELNTSTFVARVVASSGADLYAIVGAGLGAIAGPKHGGACDRIEALIDEVVRGPGAARVLRDRLRRGDAIVGFGHPFYTGGDPRGGALMALGAALARRGVPASSRARVKASREIVQQLGSVPSIDYALVFLCDVLGLPPGAALAMFTVGRTAGWVAHALEQRASGDLLRPRARYVGP